MIIEQYQILLVATIVACSCVIPGILLVIRRISLISDAISHSILLGIVVTFLILQDTNSYWMIFSASFVGLLTVFCTDLLIQTKKLKKDAAIGFVFPVFFSIALILINVFASNVHLDQDAVLLGEIAFAPLNILEINNKDWGPVSLWISLLTLIFNLTFLLLFYKELKLSTFDKLLSSSLGFSPILIHYGVIFSASITSVSAFESIGSVLVVAFMIVPAATAYLFVKTFAKLILWSIILCCNFCMDWLFLSCFYRCFNCWFYDFYYGITIFLSFSLFNY